MELFEKVDFFGLYKTYVQVIAAASTSEGIKDWYVLRTKTVQLLRDCSLAKES